MNCPPDCAPCRATRHHVPALRDTMHRECGHWRHEQRWDSEYVMIMCALFWELGRKYGRAETHAERAKAERGVAIIGAEMKEAAE